MIPRMEIPEPELHHIRQNLYILTEKYSYEWRLQRERFRVVVPSYFMCNVSSVLHRLSNLLGIPPDDHMGPIVVLNFLYAQKGELYGMHQIFVEETQNWKSLYGRWYRSEANKLYCRMLREQKIPRKKRHLMYKGLQLFGGSRW